MSPAVAAHDFGHLGSVQRCTGGRVDVIKNPGSNLRATNTGWFVSDVDKAQPAVGRIERADQLLAINGDERYATLRIFNWRLVDGGSR